ncbi:MAG: hypothetical protein ACXV2F_07645, partial [Halobacteriota archaeon]
HQAHGELCYGSTDSYANYFLVCCRVHSFNLIRQYDSPYGTTACFNRSAWIRNYDSDLRAAVCDSNRRGIEESAVIRELLRY